MDVYYASLDDAKNELKAGSDSNTVEDAKLRTYLGYVSRRIDNIMNPSGRRPAFMPYTEQLSFEISSRNIDSRRNVFYLQRDLMAYSEVLIDGTSVTANVENYPLTDRPIRAMHLNDDSKTWYDINTSTGRQPFYVKVTGQWGYHSDYANAWLDYDDLGANITAAATSLTVGDADGADPFGFTPRFSPGQLLRINSEFIGVSAVNTTTDTLTIRRGLYGSTAAAHTSGDDVEVFQVEPNIRRVTTRQAAAMYSRMGAFEQINVVEIGLVQYPSDLLRELRIVLMEYNYG